MVLKAANYINAANEIYDGTAPDLLCSGKIISSSSFTQNSN